VVFNGTDYVLLGTYAPIFNVDNLRLDGNTLSSTDTNGNIVLAPNGTGDVQVDADTLRVGDSNATATITTNGTGNLVLNTNAGTNAGSITLANGANGNFTFAPNGTGYGIFSGTQAILIPKGNNTTERPGTPVTGMLRYNTTSDEFEGYSGASPSWKSVGGAAISNDTATASDLFPTFVSATTGTAATLNTSNAKLLYKPSTGELKASAPVASNGILVNSTTMAASYTIATGTNGLSVGPFTINSGVTLTIDSGQRHLIL